MQKIQTGGFFSMRTSFYFIKTVLARRRALRAAEEKNLSNRKQEQGLAPLREYFAKQKFWIEFFIYLVCKHTFK
jgi:hypothetical protein